METTVVGVGFRVYEVHVWALGVTEGCSALPDVSGTQAGFGMHPAPIPSCAEDGELGA